MDGVLDCDLGVGIGREFGVSLDQLPNFGWRQAEAKETANDREVAAASIVSRSIQ